MWGNSESTITQYSYLVQFNAQDRSPGTLVSPYVRPHTPRSTFPRFVSGIKATFSCNPQACWGPETVPLSETEGIHPLFEMTGDFDCIRVGSLWCSGTEDPGLEAMIYSDPYQGCFLRLVTGLATARFD
jgi:hypothetical protein